MRIWMLLTKIPSHFAGNSCGLKFTVGSVYIKVRTWTAHPNWRHHEQWLVHGSHWWRPASWHGRTQLGTQQTVSAKRYTTPCCLKKKNTQFVCYHTQVWTSPDVNPIGNLWAQIKSSSEIWTEVPERSLLQRSTCSGSRRLELSPFVTNSHKSTPDHIKSLINARAGWTNHYKLFQFCYSSRTHQGCCFQNELSL